MSDRPSLLDRLLRFCLDNKLVVGLLFVLVTSWGVLVAPFDWEIEGVPRSPVPVDAIPDTGENQQIIFTSWPGRSPQDVEDQVTYPLTVALLGVPGVKTIRSSSMLGFSSIFVIFDDDVEFYWSRTRLLEEAQQLGARDPPGRSAADARPGCDATRPGLLVHAGRTHAGWGAGWRLGPARVAHDPGLVRALQPRGRRRRS